MALIAALVLGLAVLLSLGVSLSPPAQAQPVSVPLLQRTLGGDEKRNLPQPHPTSLVSGWWHYFDAEGMELRRRIERTLEDLRQFGATLPDGVVDEARSYLNLIRANLRALPEARGKRASEPPAPPAYAQNYTPAQYLALAQRVRELNARLAAEEADYAIAARDFAADVGRNDTQFAAYLKLNVANPGRAVVGLQIMADRLAQLNTAERLRLQKAELDAMRLRSRQLAAELGEARRRLVGDGASLVEANRQIDWAETALTAAHERVVEQLAEASTVVGDTPKAKATEQLRQQQVISAQVAEAAAQLRLLHLRVEQALNTLLLQTGDSAADAVREKLGPWQDLLDDVEERLEPWRSASERERRRAGSLVGAEEKPLEPSNVASINQQRFTLAQETLVAVGQLRDQIAQGQLGVDLVEEQLLSREGLVRRWLARVWQVARQLSDVAGAGLNASLFTIGDTPVTALGLLRIVLILFLAWLLSYWIRRLFSKLGARGDGANLPAFYTIGRLSHYLLILAGILIGLSSIGMDFTSFALVAGALAIGIGFGLQAIVNNFISGLILLFERSLKVGDFVQLGSGVAGEVKAINVRSTQIKTNEDIDIVVPNSEFMNSNVINWTLQQPYRRVHYPFRVAFGCDKDQVRRAGLEAAENTSHTLSGIPGKNPQVWLVDFGENGYTFELVVWLTPSAVKRPQAVRAAYYWELETALKKYAIKVPVPQRDLYLRAGFERLAASPGRAGGDGVPTAEPEPLAPPATLRAGER